MSVNSAIDIGMTGLLGFSQELQTISNNVANLNTPGFKGSETQFSDLFSQNNNPGGGSNTASGEGLEVLAPVINFSSGQTTQTGIATNMLDSGNSFFVLKDPKTGQISYTQDGQFQFNSSGVLTDSTGKYDVQALGTNGQLTNLSQSGLENNPAKASTSITLTGNISTATGASNQISTITVYDANGGTHTLTATFTQSATAGTWTVAIQDGTTTVASGGSFVFSSGAISSAAGSDGFAFTYSPTGAPAMSLNLKLDPNSTSNANTASLSVQTVDGNGAGTVTNASFNQSGTLVLNYSNGQTANGPTVALANFASTADLKEDGTGNNAFTVANNSEAQLGTAGTSSAWGSITSNAIEASNVDLSTEFSEIIITQRGYQAASEIVSTANQMLQNLLEMKGQS